MALSVPISPKTARRGFTLVELLTVIAIIAILAALTLAAASSVMMTAGRSRAKTEIQAISTALENYKLDNGAYPVGNTTTTGSSVLTGPPNAAYGTLDPSTTGGNYQISSEALYQALSGQTYFTAPPVVGTKAYMSFKKNQIGSPTVLSYIQDPWGYSYGYSTGDNAHPQVLYPYNGSGFFDLWSTGGTLGVTASNPTPANTWIKNWQ